MRPASVAFNEAAEKLEAVMVHGRLTPPAPSLIPMRLYYELADEEQSALIAAQQEAIARQERAGLRPRSPKSSNPGEGGINAPKFQSVRNNSSTSLFSKRKSDMLGRRSSMRKLSDQHLPNGHNGGEGVPTPMLRRQSMVVSQHNNVTSPNAVPAHLREDPLPPTASSAATIPFGGKLLKPLYNPYRNHDVEEAKLQRSLRPHTMALLEPLHLEISSQARNPSEVLNYMQEQLKQRQTSKEQTTLQSAPLCVPMLLQMPYDLMPHVAPVVHSLEPDASRDHVAAKMQQQAAKTMAKNAAVASATRSRLAQWRELENDQLMSHHRREVTGTILERDKWDAFNHRQREILDKVELVQSKAEALERSKRREKERLIELAEDSKRRVDMECLLDAESTFRSQLEACEEFVRRSSLPQIS